MKPALPMRYRLVNPTPAFLGRAREQAWLREAVGRAPVVLVCGLAGMGKTSLVLKTLHTEFRDHVGCMIMISLPAKEVHDQLLRELLQVLSLLQGIERVDWKVLLGNVDLALETILDLAEQAGAWMVIDDLHHAPRELMHAFLGTVAAYARKSRWIAMSRIDPRLDALEPQCLRLAGMSEADLFAVGRLLWPNEPEVTLRCAVAGAGGSPWRMKQLLKGCPPQGAPLPNLPAQTEAFVTMLHALSEPLPLKVVERLERVPAPEKLVELEQLGIIERTSEGYRLHDAALSLLDATAKVDQALYRRIAQALSVETEPRAQLLALRHYCAAGDIQRATNLLATIHPGLLAAGYGRELWSILAPRTEASLAASRLRCAVDLGDATALAAVSMPESAGPAERLLWAERLYMLGHLAEALAVAMDVYSTAAATGDSSMALDGGLMCAGVLADTGRAAEALDRLDELTPVWPKDRTRIDAIRVRCFGDLGLYDEAAALCSDLRTRLHELDISKRIEICYQVAIPMVGYGNFRLASSIFDLVPHDGTDRTLSTHHSRLFLTVRVGAALAAGRLDEARQILEKLEPFRDRASLLQPLIDVLECARRITSGELEGVDELLRDLTGRAREQEDAFVYSLALCLELELATLFARPAPAGDVERAYLGVETPNGLRYMLWKQRIEWRRAPDGSRPVMPSLESHVGPQNAGIAEQVFAMGYLVRDEYEHAVARAKGAVATARRQGHPAHEAISLLVLCDCLLAAGQFCEAHETAKAAIALIEPFGSKRFSAGAQFAAMLSSDEPLDPVQLELFASLGKVAPDVARRAQALLGGPSCMDAVERRVHRAVVAHASGQIRTIHALAGPWRPGWGIDLPRRRVWLPKGRVVSLVKLPLLWRVLQFLVERREVSKEELVREIWNEREYHPLRHNNRLFASINKLRQLIEDAPAMPSRIVTGTDSYRVGDDEPVRVLD